MEELKGFYTTLGLFTGGAHENGAKKITIKRSFDTERGVVCTVP
jgi:hypothetical protein